jgi:opacity protein-like surface antigen
MNITLRVPSLLFAFFLFIQTNANAQNDNRSFFSVTAGYSLPVGELAREKLNDPFAGLTGAGYYGQVNYDFRIARWFGLKISGSLNKNTTKPEPIIDIANRRVEEIKGLINETTSHSWQTNVSRWKFNAAMIGPAIFLNINRVQIEGHVQGGLVQVTSPTVDMTGTFQSGKNTILVHLSPASTKDFGVGAGLSLRIPLAGALYFHMSGDFLATEAQLKDVAVNVKVDNYEVGIPINEKRFVGVANIGAGLGISF